MQKKLYSIETGGLKIKWCLEENLEPWCFFDDYIRIKIETEENDPRLHLKNLQKQPQSWQKRRNENWA